MISFYQKIYRYHKTMSVSKGHNNIMITLVRRSRVAQILRSVNVLIKCLNQTLLYNIAVTVIKRVLYVTVCDEQLDILIKMKRIIFHIVIKYSYRFIIKTI